MMTKKPIPSIPAKPKTKAKPKDPALSQVRAIVERGHGEQMELQFSLAADDPLKIETMKRPGSARATIRATRKKP